jgi:hypothetical protein
MTKPSQLDREIAEHLGQHKRYMLVDAKTGKDMRPALDFEVKEIQASRYGTKQLALRGGVYSTRLRDPDEKFTVLEARTLKHLGSSSSIEGAMHKAPAKGDVHVRGEYTSDGRHWGLGKGRMVAQRENGRWLRG